MNRVIRAGIALAALATALPTAAQEQDTRPYVFGGYEYTFREDARDSDYGNGFFLGAGKAINQFWGLEFGAFRDRFEDNGRPNEWRNFGGEVDALFFYSRNPMFQPYVSLGLGGVKNDLLTTGDSSTDFMAVAGLGFNKLFDIRGYRDLGMKADVRYRWSDTDIPGIGDLGEPQVRVGLVWALGARTTETVAGVGDADRDSVNDDADLCPNTPYGTKVNAKGCPLDSDGDGVADDQDRCPGTGKGVKVDANGCPIDENVGPNRKFEDVHFEFDRSDITDYGKAVLDNAATAIKGLSTKYPKLKVDVAGHTDWIGTDAYNQALSERRANAVKSYLMRKGVEAGRISTSAYGETKPVATNETAEGRSLNRRAEVRTHE